MKMQKLLLLVIVIVIVIGITFSSGAQEIIGQPQADYSSKRPEIKTMQKNVDIPVSPFTGQASVSIPLYTASSKSITVPISLNYSTGGIKADQTAGDFGLGWDLVAGGKITRTVRGNEDEGLRFETRPHPYRNLAPPPAYVNIWTTNRDSIINLYHKYGGYYIDAGNIGNTSAALSTEFQTHNQALSNGSNPQSYNSLPYFYNALSDGEPDIFYYSFGRYSGKFILTPDPVIIPYNEDLKIVPELKYRMDTVTTTTADTTIYKQYYFNSFKISTPDGKDYYFGETDGSKIQTKMWDKPNMFNGWQLTRIIDRNTADTVYFEYTGIVPADVRSLENRQQFVKGDEGCMNTRTFMSWSQPNLKGMLSKIWTSKELITLSPSSVLNVTDRNTTKLYQSIALYYAISNSGKTILKGIINTDMNTSKAYSYSFDYYNSTPYGGTTAQDFWGYHNGAANGARLFLPYPGCTSNNVNRYPAWPAMQLDALVAITYPNGGKTIFEYEPHDANTGRTLSNTIAAGDAFYIPYLNFSLYANNAIGGLRIKRLTQYDPVTGDSLIQHFLYKRFDSSSTSSGHLYIPPSLLVDYSSLTCGSNYLNPQFLQSTQNLYRGDGTGKYISYNNVTVMEEKNGVYNGRTEYEYYNDTNTDSSFYSNATTDTTNFSLNDQYNVFPSTQFKLLPENLLSGKEKEKRIYNKDNQLLTRETTVYKSKVFSYTPATLFTSIYKYDPCRYVYQSTGGGGSGGTFLDSKKYLTFPNDQLGAIYTNIVDSIQGNSTDTASAFSGGNGVRHILPAPYSYYYMYRYAISKIVVRPYLVIKQQYQPSTGFVIDTTTYNYESANHVQATSITTSNSKNGSIKKQFLYSFDFNDVNNGDSSIYFMKKAFLNIPVASFAYTNGNIIGGGYRTYKFKSRTDSTVFLQGDEYRLRVASPGVTPATLNIASTYPQALSYPATYFQNVLSYQYNIDNTVSQLTKTGNDKMVFLWDYNRSFVVAQASGADSSDIAYTSFETSYDGNWAVSGSARDTTKSVTGSKAYNLSAGNITKSGLNTAKKYIVSYWSPGAPATINTTSAELDVNKNGWNHYIHRILAGTSNIAISGNVIIDELRLYPDTAQLTTWTFEPVLGVRSVSAPNNEIAFYEYDGLGRLIHIQDIDKKMTKSAQYSYLLDSIFTVPTWYFTGRTVYKKCSTDTSFNSTTVQNEYRDMNVNSLTYNSTKWVENSCSNCDVSAWINTTTVNTCIKDSNNQNTGYKQQEQKDVNPCSSTYNQLRWVKVLAADTSMCPVPPPPCTGEDKRLINGSCVTGTKIITASVYVSSLHRWSYTYHYEWLPDCARSVDYSAYSSTAISPGGSCSPL